MSREEFKMMRFSSFIKIGILLGIPVLLILLQPDAGSALVYSSFILVMYREGMHGSLLLLCFIIVMTLIFTLLYPPILIYSLIIIGSLIAFLYYRKNKHEFYQAILWTIGSFLFLLFLKWLLDWTTATEQLLLLSYLSTCCVGIYFIYRRKMYTILLVILASWLCIGATIGVDSVFEKLPRHQQDRINDLLGIKNDLANAGYNVFQSKIAIGSGGFAGKGFLEGTQTKYNFVPEQHTDFIFCTIGEEFGFIGSFVLLLLYLALLIRLILLAERQRSPFSRIYGYAIASIIFFHLMVNIGMTIGLMPVIGIPLPFLSYGGSSLLMFSLMFFVFLKQDANKMNIL
jgi:rod shape determining protein RodA